MSEQHRPKERSQDEYWAKVNQACDEHAPYPETDCPNCFLSDKLKEELLKQDKKAEIIFRNIAERIDDRGHFLEKFARMFNTANERNKKCLMPAAHRLIEEYDLENQQKEKGVLHEAQYM